ncbi:hypothetical protein SCLCIDRAFT_673500 [Scleroderma citrinum Foug A]|uniref:Uncharacterized protein n=1 Tax=Scleroderma citrinum Foug A TaxID=1036808 RepID=A0A0C2ZQR3_9AGAM|nr:hypothetical protein SCLCIDRAFT_673500 [Scleroderma citrinum Foug A]
MLLYPSLGPLPYNLSCIRSVLSAWLPTRHARDSRERLMEGRPINLGESDPCSVEEMHFGALSFVPNHTWYLSQLCHLRTSAPFLFPPSHFPKTFWNVAKRCRMIMCQEIAQVG